MIELKTRPTDRLVELGGGDNPRLRPNVDCRPGPNVDLVADFNKPLPLPDGDFDGVFSQYAMEHVSWRNVRGFLGEVCRILRPGGKAAFVVPNTEEQMRWVLSKGWEHRPPREGMGAFEESSCVLFGDLDYPENSHKAYFSPDIAVELFKSAGFGDVHVTPCGECGTDMVVEAIKSDYHQSFKETNQMIAGPAFSPNVLGTNVVSKTTPVDEPGQLAPSLAPGMMNEAYAGDDGTKFRSKERREPTEAEKVPPGVPTEPPAVVVAVRTKRYCATVGDRVVESDSEEELKAMIGETPPSPHARHVAEGPTEAEKLLATGEGRESAFDRHYFDGGGKVGGYAREGYWDYPVHEVTARHVLARKPESVLELGCARGYVLKRLHDAGVTVNAIEISKHCYMTRVCQGIWNIDLCKTPWPTYPVYKNQVYDLCFSIATLEHVPVGHIPSVIREMARTCKRGLHGIDFGHKDDGFDKTHCTLRPKEWWDKMFAEHAPGWPVEVLDKEELERGDIPPEVLEGDGRLKINVGCSLVMFHRGWVNIDVNDLAPWAQAYRYKHLKHDVKTGMPFGTGVVDLVYASHFLEHLTYAEGRTFLRECRRVIRPDGAMRLIVPDVRKLCSLYVSPPETPPPSHVQPDNRTLSDFDEINVECAEARTPAQKLYWMSCPNHHAFYDAETLILMLEETGFEAHAVRHRETTGRPAGVQILKETLDPLPSVSLYVEAFPKVAGR